MKAKRHLLLSVLLLTALMLGGCAGHYHREHRRDDRQDYRYDRRDDRQDRRHGYY